MSLRFGKRSQKEVVLSDTGKLRCHECFESIKTDTIRSSYGSVRYIEVCLTRPDGIRSTKTVRYTEGFVISRFVVSKLT